MNNTIPYGHQDISHDDVQAVLQVLRSDFLTQGPAIPAFEKAVADYCGVKHAIAISNATAGLHLSCLALELGPGKLLWTSPNSFTASANSARYCGADVDFVDIDPGSLNISLPELAKKLELAKTSGKLPDIVMPVHFSGQSVEMRELGSLARQYGFAVIEDAAHALGAKYDGKPVGSCDNSDLVVLSFHPVKIITTGEGGMILTNRDDLAQRLRRLRTHGITRDPSLLERPNQGGWYYEQLELGFNFRMTDIQAALGTSQMRRLDQFVQRRHELADRYDRELRSLPLILPERKTGRSSLHLYVVQIDSKRTKVTRRQVYDAMIASGIGVNVHYIPIHLQPYYGRLGFKPGDFPAAEAYYERGLTLPLFPGLSAEEHGRVISALQSALL